MNVATAIFLRASAETVYYPVPWLSGELSPGFRGHLLSFFFVWC